MKKTTKVLLSIAAIGLFAAGCATTNGGGDISADSLSLRKAPVNTDSAIKLQKVTYTKAAPGQAKTIQRSYVNAPPLIPHSVKGLVPITKNNNACLGCHLPSVAKSVHATPIPKSHFIDFRPAVEIVKNGKLVKKGKIVAKVNGGANDVYAEHMNKLYPGRYNCTQCHVVQANVKPLVGNNFKPDYINSLTTKRSNLANTFDQGVDTTK